MESNEKKYKQIQTHKKTYSSKIITYVHDDIVMISSVDDDVGNDDVSNDDVSMEDVIRFASCMNVELASSIN